MLDDEYLLIFPTGFGAWISWSYRASEAALPKACLSSRLCSPNWWDNWCDLWFMCLQGTM